MAIAFLIVVRPLNAKDGDILEAWRLFSKVCSMYLAEPEIISSPQNISPKDWEWIVSNTIDRSYIEYSSKNLTENLFFSIVERSSSDKKDAYCAAYGSGFGEGEQISDELSNHFENNSKSFRKNSLEIGLYENMSDSMKSYYSPITSIIADSPLNRLEEPVYISIQESGGFNFEVRRIFQQRD